MISTLKWVYVCSVIDYEITKIYIRIKFTKFTFTKTTHVNTSYLLNAQ